MDDGYGTLKLWMTFPSFVRHQGVTQAHYVKKVVATIQTEREDAQRLVNEHAELMGKGKVSEFGYEWAVAPVELKPQREATAVRALKEWRDPAEGLA